MKMKLSDFIKEYGDCEITEDLKNMIKPKEKMWKWKPNKCEKYFFVDTFGCDREATYCDNAYHNMIIRSARVFKTIDEVKRYKEITLAFYKASFEPNWEDEYIEKWFFAYNFIKNKISKIVTNSYCYGTPYVFESEEVCKDLINKFGEKDICKYILGIDLDCLD